MFLDKGQKDGNKCKKNYKVGNLHYFFKNLKLSFLTKIHCLLSLPCEISLTTDLLKRCFSKWCIISTIGRLGIGKHSISFSCTFISFT